METRTGSKLLRDRLWRSYGRSAQLNPVEFRKNAHDVLKEFVQELPWKPAALLLIENKYLEKAQNYDDLTILQQPIFFTTTLILK